MQTSSRQTARTTSSRGDPRPGGVHLTSRSGGSFPDRVFGILLRSVVGAGCLLACAREADAGAWLLPGGYLWLKTTVMHQSSSKEFVAAPGGGRGSTPSYTYRPGQRAPYRFGGRHTWTGVFTDIAWGLTDWLEVGAQVPYYRQDYSDAQDPLFLETRGQAGVGDLRVRSRIRLTGHRVVSSVAFAAKMPTAAYRNRDGLVTLTDGQWDLDAVSQVGMSLWPLAAYVNLSAGYRVRLQNKSAGRDPGDEWLYAVEFGYGFHPRIRGTIKLEGVRGKAARSLGLEIPSDVRRVTFVFPSLSLNLSKGAVLEAGVRYPVTGRNHPAGRMLVAAVSWTGSPFGVTEHPSRRQEHICR